MNHLYYSLGSGNYDNEPFVLLIQGVEIAIINRLYYSLGSGNYDNELFVLLIRGWRLR